MKRRHFLTDILQSGALAFIVPGSLYAANRGRKANDAWQIKQFQDKGLSHFSYAVLAGQKIVLIDPGRDPSGYYRFANENGANIIAVIETHPHADFVGSHLELYKKTGAAIYTSSLMQPAYPFKPFDEGARLKITDDIVLRSIDTPGHAPDGISAILQVQGKDTAVFSGDSLLIGDVGRPDLREYSGDVLSERRELAKKMYYTVWDKFAPLHDDIVLYPAHGAGSLCGKSMRDAASSTIGYEKQHNHAFQKRPVQEFTDLLLKDLPAVPAYFPYDVALNVKGAPDIAQSIANVKIREENFLPPKGEIIIDARPENIFKSSYIPQAYNLQDGTKFETWLGSIIRPEQSFYLTAENTDKLSGLIAKTAKIGYESNIKGAFVYNDVSGSKFPVIDIDGFNNNRSNYTVIDVRTQKEAAEEKIFDSAINIPVNELIKRINEIPSGKPVIVHCASGYRSALGSSIIRKYFPTLQVFDLGATISEYKPGTKK